MPAKINWREIPTGNPDELGYSCGGQKPLVWMGVYMCLMGIICVCIVFPMEPTLRKEVLGLLRSQDWKGAMMAYIAGGLIAIFALEPLFLGILLIFGRDILLVNRATKIITREYRFFSFSLYKRVFPVSRLQSVSFKRPCPLWLSLGMMPIRLNDETGGSRRLVTVYVKFEENGRVMAKQIAEFLWVRGPDEPEITSP